jgi:serine/threonine protein kinase
MSMSISNFNNCIHCNSLIYDIEELNKLYDIDDMQDMIEQIKNFDNKKLKLFTIELYNIVNQTIEHKINKSLSPNFKKDSLENTLNKNDALLSLHEYISDENSSAASNDYYMINQYVVIKKIGSGSQGTILLASDKENNLFAIKKIINKKKISFQKNDDTNYIKNEISIMKRIDHDNVISLHEVIEDQKRNIIYIVMPYMEKGQIINKINNDTYEILPIEKIIKYTKQIISGLRYLHNNKIVHHDIKPENILIDKNDVAHITDFGVSEILSKYNVAKNRNGTFHFFSPELFLIGSNIIGDYIDIWALGVTIFVMLYGKFPFNGYNFGEIKDSVINKNPEYPDNATDIEKEFFDFVFHKDTKKRLNLNGIKNHPFMKYANHKNKDKDIDKDIADIIFLDINKHTCCSKESNQTIKSSEEASYTKEKEREVLLLETPSSEELHQSINIVREI